MTRMDQSKFIIELESNLADEMLHSWEAHSFEVRPMLSNGNGIELVIHVNYHVLVGHVGEKFHQRVENSLKARRVRVKFVEPDGSKMHEHVYRVLSKGVYIPAVEGHHDSVKNVVQQLIFRVLLVES